MLQHARYFLLTGAAYIGADGCSTGVSPVQEMANLASLGMGKMPMLQQAKWLLLVFFTFGKDTFDHAASRTRAGRSRFICQENARTLHWKIVASSILMLQ